jgi:NAD(P)-dependent dehydrogenase (short-subunit alcohol dehydrogenase family)
VINQATLNPGTKEMESGLKGKVILIAGAASGIGRAAALAFANEGADFPTLSHNRNQNESYRCYTTLAKRFKVRISRREPDPRYMEIALIGL